MKRLVEMVVGNPAALLWLLLAAFVAGLASGAAPAWYVQGLRLDALQSKHDGISGLIAEGDAGAVGLNVARSWASGIRGGMFLGSPAKSQP